MEKEKEIMIIAILGIVIGLLVAGAGIYFLKENKNDVESKKIYSIVIAVGIIVAAAAGIYLGVSL